MAAFEDIMFVAVKPQFYAEVLEEIKDLLTEEQILVSIAPGKTLVWFDEVLGRNLKVIRTMPNTPSMVKEGMMGMCAGARVTDADMALVRDLYSGCGYCRQRKLSGLCIYVYRSHGRCSSGWWNAETAGVQICSTGGTWKCKDGS